MFSLDLLRSLTHNNFRSSFSMFLFGTSLSIQFAIGAGVILVSVYLFSNDIPAMCKGKVKQDEHVEMSPMLPK